MLYQQTISDRLTVFGEFQDWQTTSARRFSTNELRSRVIESFGDFGTPGDFLFTDGDPDAAFEGTRLDANVLRYGFGAAYDLWRSIPSSRERRFTAVIEVVGWTVLDGFQTDISGQLRAQNVVATTSVVGPFTGVDSVEITGKLPSIRDARGDTIVNGKYGLRYSSDQNSIYVGYGHNWTGPRWYSDLLRVELTRDF